MRTKEPTSIPRFKWQPAHHSTLHTKAITKAEQAKPMTAEEILEAASPTVQDSHWDAITHQIYILGTGE